MKRVSVAEGSLHISVRRLSINGRNGYFTLYKAFNHRTKTIFLMRQSHVLLLIIIILFAGCTGITPGSDSSTEETDPEACDEVAMGPTPEKPSDLTQQSAIEYVEAHANASVWNQLANGSQSVSIKSVFTSVLNRTESGYVIHVTTDYGYQLCDGAHGDDVDNRDYFINDSLIAVRLSSNRTYFTSAEKHRLISATEVLQNGTVITSKNTTG